MKYYIKQKLRESIMREVLIQESAIGKTLVVVDVQPEYQSYFVNMHHNLFEYINEHNNQLSNLLFLYNGESLGMIEEHEFRYWMLDNGLDEEIAFSVDVYDKGYAFFRYCIDGGIDDENIVNLIKYMIHIGVNDSRDLDEDFWNGFIEKYGDENIRELLEFSDDAINIPDLMDILKPLNNITLVGGGINECLKEVEIALDTLNKSYYTWPQFTY
jgi:hypothetical protein|tara:strand:- start:1987 stop:2628 length:642 start_codon:yes stop_codon:yes gene_type:complete